METETLLTPNAPPTRFVDPIDEPPQWQPSGPPPGPPVEPPVNPTPAGLGPTPDPTRSGALWVGGAGVVLLLAAAGVLTAVRWDDIGQSAKLGGLVAITLALLAAGQRFTQSIPMTAQAIFHLGALLIPFDMAAVAILAGRSWQETLLLTSVTSVGAWYGIERAVPSAVLKWCARGGVVAMAGGIAAVSTISMPLALAVFAVVGIVGRRPIAAGTWALIAGVLPVGSFIAWPTRIAGSMTDLGFDDLDRWQPLAAGVIASAVLVAVSRLEVRMEVAWAAVVTAAITTVVALGGFADANISYLTIAALFLGAEVLAMVTTRDPLWKPIVGYLASGAELVGACVTVVLCTGALADRWVDVSFNATTVGMSSALVALAWLTADRRRLQEDVGWFTGLVIGSDWFPTTILFPAAMLAVAAGFGLPAYGTAFVAVGLAYWMVATWRTGSAYGAIVLVTFAALLLGNTNHWIEFALAGASAAVLMLAAQLRVRARDDLGAVLASVTGVVLWVAGTASAVAAFDPQWPLVIVMAGAWSMSWIVEARGIKRSMHPVDWVGRGMAAVLVISSVWADPVVSVLLCASAAALAAIDYTVVRHRGAKPESPLLTGYLVAAGTAAGLAGVPIAALAGLATAPAGAALAIAGFVLVGIALVSPQEVELPVGVAAVVMSTVGLAMALGEAGAFALALIAVGSTALFMAAALRDPLFGAAGYTAVGLGVALQLAVWEVTWLEAYLFMPALAVLYVGYRFQKTGANSWAAYAPTIALFSYVAIADRIGGGSAWHTVIAGAVGIVAIIAGGYRRLVGPLVTGSVVLAIVVGYESLGPAALVPTWAWLATGGTVLLAAGVAMERSDTTPLEQGERIRSVIATQFS